MKKQPILMAFLMICHTFSIYSQAPYRPKTKEDFAVFFNKPAAPETPVRTTYHSNGNSFNSDGPVSIYAVVVGVGEYQEMPQLAYPASDARHFYDELLSVKGGSIPASHIRLLQDENATASNVFYALKELASKADGNDVIIFYFSGHGLNGSFLPVDFDGANHRLDHYQIVRILENSRAKHKICIADACFSGNLNYSLAAKGVDTYASSEPLYSAFENTSGGMALLMSSSSQEASWEDSGLQQGVFTYYLIQGMSGSADYDHNHIVSVSELYGYVYRMVKRHTGGHQTPVLTGNFDDEMPVSLTK